MSVQSNNKYGVETLLKSVLRYDMNTSLLKVLLAVKGLNKYRIEKTLLKMGINAELRVGELSIEQFKTLKCFFEWESKTKEFRLMERTFLNNYEKKLQVYKYKRKELGLPVNGQRTHSNAKTARYFLTGGQKMQKNLNKWLMRKQKRTKKTLKKKKNEGKTKK